MHPPFNEHTYQVTSGGREGSRSDLALREVPLTTLNLSSTMVVCSMGPKNTVRWPSGLRRQTKAYVIQAYLVRKGVGSNPTLINLLL